MDAYVNSLAGYLLAQSWQIALLAVVVALISFALRNRSAHVRYLLWLIVLAKCIVPPVYSVPVPVLPDRPLIEQLPRPATPETQVVDVAVKATSPIEIEAAVEPQESKLALPGIKETAVLVWSLGAFLFLVWINIRAIRYTLWLRSRRSPLPDSLKQKLQESFETLKFKKLPRIWLTRDIGQPFVWGLLRGSVYLPVDFLALDDPERCRTILAHELSHVVRFDAAINVLQVVAQAIYWFHPLVWWMNGRIRQEREKCCDEMTVVQLNTLPEHYTNAIVETLAAEHRSAHPIPSLAIVGSIKDIEERIRTMMRPGKRFYKRPSMITITVILVLAFVIVPTALVLTARAEGTKTVLQSEDNPSKSLHQAATDGDLGQVKELLSKGTGVNETDQSGLTPLHLAAMGGHKAIVEFLLTKGADVNAKKKTRSLLGGDTPLHETAKHGHKDVAEVLIAKGADIKARTKTYDTALYYAAVSAQKEFAELLLANGADVDAALYSAAGHGDHEAAKFLLAKGANVNAKNVYEWAPLHWAALYGHKDVTELLVAKGAEVNVHSDELAGMPLHLAASFAHKEVIEFLIANGADVNAKNNYGRTALHDAMDRGQTEIVELLRKHGADTQYSMEREKTKLGKSLFEVVTKKCIFPEQSLNIPEPMQPCGANLQKIYAAIKKYEKDKGRLPDWLSDLVPDYLTKEMLLCPHKPSYRVKIQAEPKIPCSYGYEFSLLRRPATTPRGVQPRPWGGMLSRDLKMAQVRLFGDVVPLLRCRTHGYVLNLSVGGQLYISPLFWERMFLQDYFEGLEQSEEAKR
jgi:ankyrin repeat protein/beta-lactamase regulating signal transducer with metallopeptidase domain